MGTDMHEVYSASVYDEDGKERELQCPKCGCPGLTFEEDISDCIDDYMYFGMHATCDECGHKFVVTGNCWRLICECD